MCHALSPPPPPSDTRAVDDDVGAPEEGTCCGCTSTEAGEGGGELVKGRFVAPIQWSMLQVEEKVNKMQRRYFLQEQLKIIKRELGLEVCVCVMCRVCWV